MRVKDLVEQLSKLDPELPVLMQLDAEGNGFDTLGDVLIEQRYYKESYEIFLVRSDDEDAPAESTPCVVLCP